MKLLKIYAAAIGWALAGILFFIHFSYRLTSKMSLQTWAEYAGKLQADAWFHGGNLRLLELSPNPKTEFTGRTEGPFEIWTWTRDTNAYWVIADSADQPFVEAFNKKMRQLNEQKGKTDP